MISIKENPASTSPDFLFNCLFLLFTHPYNHFTLAPVIPTAIGNRLKRIFYV